MPRNWIGRLNWLHRLTPQTRNCPLMSTGRPPPLLTPTRRRSRFGPPLAVVAVARTRLTPELRVAVTDTSAQVVQAPVGLNARPALTTVPLTVTDIGRSAVVPLAKR